MKMATLFQLLRKLFISECSATEHPPRSGRRLSYIVVSYTTDEASNVNARLKRFDVDGVEGLTLGFKKTLSKVFSHAYEQPNKTKCIDLLGSKAEVRHIFILESSAMLLGKTQPRDFLVVYVIQPKRFDKSLLEALHMHLLKGYSEQDIVRQLETELSDREFAYLPSLKKEGFPGIKLFTPPLSQIEPRTASLLCGFYYYGWLIATRLERGQSDIDVSNSFKQLTKTRREIVDHRITLINLDRYFLTMNRSNSPEIKEICRFLLKELRLVKRYNRHELIHRNFETHLTNLSRRAEIERARNVKRVVEVLTFLIVPLGAFTAVMSIRLNNPLISEPGVLVENIRFWKITTISLLVPILFVIVAALTDAIRRALDWIKSRVSGREDRWW